MAEKTSATTGREEPFDIDEVMARVETAVEPFPKAAMFELAEAGYDTPLQQLIGCIISIRTRDEVSLPTSIRLFERAATAAAIAALPVEEIDALINTSSFHERKAEQIRAIAQTVADAHGGELPCDRELLLSFSGVGPKCANLALGVACGEMEISVDVHVHRVTNRWGYVETNAPEQTMRALEEKLPRRYWIDINRLLVPFGKHICQGRLPLCSRCPVEPMCAQVGVEKHR